MRTSGSSSARSARSRPSSASRAGNRAGGRPRPKVTAGVVEEGVTDPGGARARAIAHVDMDAFYAAIEQRDRSELRGKPVIVGADPRGRGVGSAASYEARAVGGEARCLAPLPGERIWGVGRVTAGALRELGLRTIGQLQRGPRPVLARRLGKHGHDLHDLAFGRDDRPVEPFGAPKSVGAEETFGADTTDAELLRTTLRAQAERVAAELREGGFAASRVTLKLRLQPFETHTRSATGEATQDGLELYRRALALLERERVARPVRLIGLSASRLGPGGRGQLDLLDPTALRRERLARVVDRLTERFGEGAVIPATLLARPRREPPRRDAREH